VLYEVGKSTSIPCRAIARINANDHFISNVAATIALMGLLTLLFATLTKRRISPNGLFEPIVRRNALASEPNVQARSTSAHAALPNALAPI
jgi:hypothetical protein